MLKRDRETRIPNADAISMGFYTRSANGFNMLFPNPDRFQVRNCGYNQIIKRKIKI